MSDANGVLVTFNPTGRTAQGQVGQTLLEVAEANGIPLESACGGAGVCSTCHVIVRQGAALLDEATEEEEDTLDTAPSVTPESRLACQARITRPGAIVVDVPAWNRNLVSEHG